MSMAQGGLSIFFTVFMIASVAIILIDAVTRWSRALGEARMQTPGETR